MASLVIKDLPLEIHRRLKKDAEEHHRSMIGEAIAILEQGLHRVRPIPEFRPWKGTFPLTNAFINRAKREGRP
jgi:plasmid stability protein